MRAEAPVQRKQPVVGGVGTEPGGQVAAAACKKAFIEEEVRSQRMPAESWN